LKKNRSSSKVEWQHGDLRYYDTTPGRNLKTAQPRKLWLESSSPWKSEEVQCIQF